MQKIGLYGFLIYFSWLSILPGNYVTHLDNLLKLHNHFILHLAEKSSGSDLTWLDFLIAHFWDSSKHHHDHPLAHKDLPLYNQINLQNPVLCPYLIWDLNTPGAPTHSLVVEVKSGLLQSTPLKVFSPPRV